MRLRTVLPRLLLGLGLLVPISVMATSLPQAKGKFYELSIESRLSPIMLNQIHGWELVLRDAQGDLVPNAVITVNGGMPEHQHGLPTAPRVTEVLGPGRYLLEGVKFQMPGRWVMQFRIEAGKATETLTLGLDL